MVHRLASLSVEKRGAWVSRAMMTVFSCEPSTASANHSPLYSASTATMLSVFSAMRELSTRKSGISAFKMEVSMNSARRVLKLWWWNRRSKECEEKDEEEREEDGVEGAATTEGRASEGRSSALAIFGASS